MVMNTHRDKHKTAVKDFQSEMSFTMRGFASSIMPLLTSVDEYSAATGKEKRYGRREKSRTLYPGISSDVWHPNGPPNVSNIVADRIGRLASGL